MNILHLCNTPLSGSPYRLMMIQKKMGHNARLINARVRYSDLSNIIYPQDILLQNDPKTKKPLYSKEEIYFLFKNADIIHCHNFYKEQLIFRFMPELKKYLKTKHVVLQVHSPRSSLKNIGPNLKDPTVDTKLVIAQFQARQFKECQVVPNAIDIFEEPYINIKRDPKFLPRIVYSPSNTCLKGWNNKGHYIVSKVLNTVHSLASTEIITNTPHLECIARKQKADISIDEFMTGSYHLCTLEGLSHGQVVFCHLDKFTKEAIQKISPDPLPIINTTPKKFKHDLHDLLQDPKLINKMGSNARKFMEKNWTPQKINKRYETAYKS
jgi:hypothetical protein